MADGIEEELFNQAREEAQFRVAQQEAQARLAGESALPEQQISQAGIIPDPRELRMFGKSVTDVLPTPENVARAGEAGVNFLPDVAAGGAAMGVTALGQPQLAVPAAAAAGAVGKGVQRFVAGQDIVDPSLVKEGAAQGVFEGVGEIVARGGSRAFRAFRGAIEPGALEANVFLTDLAKSMQDILTRADPVTGRAGMTPEQAARLTQSELLPAEFTQSRMLDFVQNLGEGSIFGQSIADFRQLRDEFLDKSIEQFMRVVGPSMSPDDTATLVATALKQARAGERQVMGEGHKVVGRKMAMARVRAGGQSSHGMVDMVPVKAALKRQRRVLKELKGASLDPEGVAKLIKRIDDMPDALTFESAKEMRTDIDDLVAAASSPLTPRRKVVAAGTELRASITGEMERSLQVVDADLMARGQISSLDDGVFAEWEAASAATKEFYEGSGGKFIEQIIRKVEKDGDGPAALGKILQNNNTSRITEIRDIVGKDSVAWKTVQTWHLANVFQKAKAGGIGAPIGARLKNSLFEVTGFGQEATEALYGKELSDELQKYASALRVTQAKNAAPGKMAMQFAEAGTAVAAPVVMMTGDPTAKSTLVRQIGGLIITGAGLNKWLTNPRRVADMTTLTKFGAKTRAGAAAFSRLVASLGRDDYREVGEKVSPEQVRAENLAATP